MATSMYESMWSRMSENRLVFDSEEDLTCELCKQLMTDSCQGVCGCHYCYQCIRDYTSDGDKHCPGNGEYCHEVYLVWSINLFRNNILNKKISKVKVTCPNQSCMDKVELFQLDDHLRLCINRLIDCPYAQFGCTSESRTEDKMESHLLSDSLVHTELLVEIIHNLRCEINVLKENNGGNDNELLNRELAVLREEIEGLKREKDNLIAAMNSLEGSENDESRLLLEHRIYSMEEQWRQFGQEMSSKTDVEDVKIDIENIINDLRKNLLDEMKPFKEESTNQEIRLVPLQEDLRQVTEEMRRRSNENTKKNNEAAKERQEMLDEIKFLRYKIEKMESVRLTYEDDEKRKMIKWVRWNKLCPNIDVDFVWRLDQCSKKINVHMFSESFYSNNYRFCLYAFIGSDDNLSLGFYVMRGDNDERLEWPLTIPVTVSIINQYTMATHMFERYDYNSYNGRRVGFEKPTTERNKFYIGSPSFIKYSSIKDKPSIINNDSIIVSFVLSRPSR